MIPSIRTALNAILGAAPTLQLPGGAGRAFELFLMTEIAAELQRRGYDVWIQRSDGSRIAPTDPNRAFIQRGGAPHDVYSAAAGSNNPSVIGFRYPGRTTSWEIWNGIPFRGRSQATHEIDIAIVPAEVGQTLRNLPTGGTPTGRPRVSIECKDVGTAGSVDEMRAFVARLYDITLLGMHHQHLGINGPAQTIHPGAVPHLPVAQTYWEENRQTLNIIARRTGFVVGAGALTGYHAIDPRAHITVGSANAHALWVSVADWIVAQKY